MYIVKNCPNLSTSYYETGRVIHNQCGLTDDDLCADCTCCVIKQVIEKCKGAISNYSNLEILRTACETSEAYGKANIAEQILQLFDIEETNK